MLTSSKHLLEALACALELVRSAPDHPLRLSATRNLLLLEARHDDAVLRQTLACSGNLFEKAIDARALLAFIKSARRGNGETMVELTESSAELVEISCASSRAAFAVQQVSWPDDLAFGNETASCAVEVAELLDKLRWVMAAVSADPSRTTLHGVRFDSAAANVVASDGHRLHLARVDGLTGPSFTVPVHVAKALASIAAAPDRLMTITVGDAHARFVCGDVSLVSPLKSEGFPPYQQVIPRREAQTFGFIARSKALLSAAKAVSKERVKSVPCSLRMNGAVVLEHSAGGRMHRRVFVDVLQTTHEGELTTVGVDARYLRDAASAIDDIVDVSFGSSLEPILLTYGGGDMKAVVMPMRV